MKHSPSTPTPQQADMAKVYDNGAEAFQAEAPGLFSWRALGAPALYNALRPTFEAPNLEDLRWLDEGSASGRIVQFLIDHGVPARQIDGVEISPEQVALAQKAIPEAHFRVSNLATDSLGDGVYDRITRHMVDEHLNGTELLAASKSTLTALKPGGKLVAVFTHPDRVKFTEGDKIQPDGSYVTKFPWGGEGANYYRTPEEYLAVLEEAGFKIESTESLQITPETEKVDPSEYKRYMDMGYQGLNVRLAVTAQRTL